MTTPCTGNVERLCKENKLFWRQWLSRLLILCLAITTHNAWAAPKPIPRTVFGVTSAGVPETGTLRSTATQTEDDALVLQNEVGDIALRVGQGGHGCLIGNSVELQNTATTATVSVGNGGTLDFFAKQDGVATVSCQGQVVPTVVVEPSPIESTNPANEDSIDINASSAWTITYPAGTDLEPGSGAVGIQQVNPNNGQPALPGTWVFNATDTEHVELVDVDQDGGKETVFVLLPEDELLPLGDYVLSVYDNAFIDKVTGNSLGGTDAEISFSTDVADVPPNYIFGELIVPAVNGEIDWTEGVWMLFAAKEPHILGPPAFHIEADNGTVVARPDIFDWVYFDGEGNEIEADPDTGQNTVPVALAGISMPKVKLSEGDYTIVFKPIESSASARPQQKMPIPGFEVHTGVGGSSTRLYQIVGSDILTRNVRGAPAFGFPPWLGNIGDIVGPGGGIAGLIAGIFAIIDALSNRDDDDDDDDDDDNNNDDDDDPDDGDDDDECRLTDDECTDGDPRVRAAPTPHQ